MPDLPLTRLPLYAYLVPSCPVFVVPGVLVWSTVHHVSTLFPVVKLASVGLGDCVWSLEEHSRRQTLWIIEQLEIC